MIHVMIVSSVMIHQFVFDGKSYAATGEIVYIGLFMLLKTIGDLWQLKKRPELVVDALVNI